MPRETRTLTDTDFLPLTHWAGLRKDHRKALSLRKKSRRIAVGPYATFHFENWDTMWYQVQEMLWIEKGGADQLPDELAAYNPMVPNGSELTATLMFEISDEAKRRTFLSQLGGVEDHIAVSINGDRVVAIPEQDLERTTDDGKTSSVHFLHFRFTAEQIAKFRDPSSDVMIRIDHPHYGHAALITGETRTELSGDFA
jgi:hypothetical protein